MGKLYLHVGLHKTGTSSIQNWLAQSRPELLESGYVYPGTQVHHNDLYLALCPAPEKEHANLRRGVEGREAATAQARQVLHDYGEAARLAGDRDLVISGEEICRLDVEGVRTLKALFEPFVSDYEILCFVRSPVGFSSSYAQEAIKGGGSTLAVETNFPFLPQYRDRIEKFVTIFSRDRVRVIDFDDPRKGPEGAVSTFARLLGPRAATLNPVDIRLNCALPMHAVELMSRINALYPEFVRDGNGSEVANPQRARIPLEGLSRLGGGRFRMSRDWQASVIAASADDVAWLRAEFGIDYSGAEPEADENGRPDPGDQLLDGYAHLLHEAYFLAEEFLAEYLRLNAQLAAATGASEDGEAFAKDYRRLRPHRGAGA
jgi:hypothetical protein